MTQFVRLFCFKFQYSFWLFSDDVIMKHLRLIAKEPSAIQCIDNKTRIQNLQQCHIFYEFNYSYFWQWITHFIYIWKRGGGVKYTLAATVKWLSEMEAAKGWITWSWLLTIQCHATKYCLCIHFWSLRHHIWQNSLVINNSPTPTKTTIQNKNNGSKTIKQPIPIYHICNFCMKKRRCSNNCIYRHLNSY